MSEESGGSRIILPGGVKPGTLLGPDGRPLSSRRDDAEATSGEPALPTHPRLRAIELQEMREGDRTVIVLTDPSGVAERALAISPEAVPILSLFDGSVALEDLVALVDRETGDPRAGEQVRKLVATLDAQLMLESPRYFAARDKVRDEYRALPERPAALAGLSYPADPAELGGFLSQHETIADERAAAAVGAAGAATVAAPAAAPRALAAPHIDLRRGGPLFAQAWRTFEGVPAEALPDVVFVFGVGHMMLEEPFAITTKPFATPLGTVAVATESVDRIVAAAGDAILIEEIAHRDEHSIEFQALAMRRRFGARDVRVVPILCSGFHGLVRFERRPAEEPRIEGVLAAVAAEAERLAASGVRVAFVAGVDFSHVGARFGDEIELDAAALAEIEKVDRAAIDAALTGDAEAWFDAVATHGDSTRICGFAATYAMLRVARPGAGRLLGYEQSVEPGGSVVTYASMVWP